ncbi:MAG: hypothetical protein JOZ72_19960 [Alphaproteobacteria bacterium]|nr:hypothetical protein [Alphaproteobacteria bacterium]
MRSARRASLHGFINPVSTMPAFVLPVFMQKGGGNAVLAQVIGHNDAIEEFVPIEIGTFEVFQNVERVDVGIGQSALWGFQWSLAQARVATRASLCRELAEASDTGEFPPHLRLAIARFAGQDDAVASLLRDAFQHLVAYSPQSGAAWRDLVILLPAARAAIGRSLSPSDRSLVRSLSDIDLRCEDGKLRIAVPKGIFAALGHDKERVVGALAPLRTMTDAFAIESIEVEEGADQRSLPVPDAVPLPRPVTLVPLGQIGAGLAVAAGKHAGLHVVDATELLSSDRARPLHSDAHAGDIYLLLLADRADEIENAERLATSLVGRGCLPAAILVRPHSATASDPESGEQRLDRLARAARWLAVIGGPQTGDALLPPAKDAEPIRNSPSLLSKWTVRALVALARDARDGAPVLERLFRRGHGAKFAVIGVGVASRARAAVDAAYSSASASRLPLSEARSIVMVVLRGPAADAEIEQQCLDEVRARSAAGTNVASFAAVLPSLKRRIRVVLLAREISPSRIWWEGDRCIDAFRARQWGYRNVETQAGKLDFVVWKDEAEFGVRVETGAEPIDLANVAKIAADTPMYYGPVVLMLRELPDTATRNRLLTWGIIAISAERMDLLDRLARQPCRTIVSRLLRARPADTVRGMQVFLRDHLMRLFWQGESDVAVWDAPRNENEPFEMPGWLEDTEPFEGQIDPFLLDAKGPGRTLHLSGQLRVSPHESKGIDGLVFAFKATLDDFGLRLREPMRRVSGNADDDGDGQQFTLDV